MTRALQSALLAVCIAGTTTVIADQQGRGRQSGSANPPTQGGAAVRRPVATGDFRREIGREREREGGETSPNAFYAQRAYEQAFPGEVGSPEVQKAIAQRYATYSSVVMRGGGSLDPGDLWRNLGPETLAEGGNASGNISGRVSAIAVSSQCQNHGRCRLWLGAAGGGVWRTDDAMHETDPKWKWIGRGLGTNSIGSLTADPNDPRGNTILVGTGETNQPNNSGAGTGLYRSTNGGDDWVRIPTMIVDAVLSPNAIDFTSTRGISTVVVEPGNSNILYVATTSAMLGMTGVRGGQTQTTGYLQPRVGLYKTDNLGKTWSLIWVPPLDPVIPPNPDIGVGVGDTMFGVRHVELDPKDSRIIYATAWNNAIHRSAPSLENGDASFKPVFAIVTPARFRDLAMFDLTVKNGRTRMYVYNGTEAVAPQGLYRLDNADVPAATLVTGSGAALTNTPAWLSLSSNTNTQPGFTSRRMCTSQCFYDLAVATPPGQPDTVIIGGVAQSTFGEPTMQSTNAGVGFSAFGGDAQPTRNESHVDVRVVVFHPRDPDIAWVGSDGGIVRNDGTYVNISNRCSQFSFGQQPQCPLVLSSVPARLFFMNKGLQTLQFYNVAVDPRDPLRRLIGGLQDNSTVWRDGSRNPLVWHTLFPFGDGTSASGFHPERREVLFASFQSNNYFTNFRNGDPGFWVQTNDPIAAAGERESITQSSGRQFLTFDQARPDTQFTAFQHVWRTQNNGGDQAFLETNCRFPGGQTAPCGDWLPLGVAYPFQAGSNPSSASRKPGDLTSDFYGTDRTGGLIVSAERTPADTGTLWAATNMGRIFIAKNADGAAASVDFVRIDTAAMPNRFVTRIFPDRDDPNVAFISFSGFNALTPGTPGHVFRAVYDPVNRRAVFTSADYDLGDMPINTIAYDDVRGDLYAGTDFGPLVLRSGRTTWEPAGAGFPESLMVDLEIVPERRLLIAATHGLGVFYLTLR